MNRNEVLDILNFRHACKEFDSTKKISSEDLEVIIEGGRLAPSSVGIEPWHFIVIENQELKDELGKVCFGGTKQIPTCSNFVIFLTRTPKEIRSNSTYIEHLLKDVQHLPEDAASKMKEFLKTAEDIVGDIIDMYKLSRGRNNLQHLLIAITYKSPQLIDMLEAEFGTADEIDESLLRLKKLLEE